MNRLTESIAKGLCTSVMRFISSPVTYIAILVIIAILTLISRRNPVKVDTQTLLSKTLSLAKAGKIKQANSGACTGSNLPVWLNNKKIISFQVGELQSTTKVNGLWVYPVPCEVQIQGESAQKVTFYLNSATPSNQCIVAVSQ